MLSPYKKIPSYDNSSAKLQRMEIGTKKKETKIGSDDEERKRLTIKINIIKRRVEHGAYQLSFSLFGIGNKDHFEIF